VVDGREIVDSMAGDDELCPPGCECPGCSEARIDLLEWIDDRTVRCLVCGAEYDPLSRLREAEHAGD